MVAVESHSSSRRFFHFVLRSLPVTGLGILLLVFGSITGLFLTESRRLSDREGTIRSLGRMADAFILIQSFKGDPRRPVPSLWNARLGVKPAGDLWQRQGGMLWWQAWSLDGEAYLILPATLIPPRSQDSFSQRYGNLVVVGTDQLHREQLLQRVKAGHAQSGSFAKAGLFASCLESLAEQTSVYWTADALASVSGTLAPLLQRGREGCMQLRLQGQVLQWNGVISQRPLRNNPAQAKLVVWNNAATEPAPVDQFTLLQVEGSALQLILGTLLSRQIIQVPLEQNYGINEVLRTQISASPFSLRLIGRPKGFYRAGLQLQIPVSGDQGSWNKVLDTVSERLRSRGYDSLPSSPAQSDQGKQLWVKGDDPKKTVIGGWRWLRMKKNPLLSIGFGIEPEGTAFIRGFDQPKGSGLVVQSDPSTLVSMDLLSGRWPKPMTKASTMTFQVSPLDARGLTKGLWRMRGQLLLPQS